MADDKEKKDYSPEDLISALDEVVEDEASTPKEGMKPEEEVKEEQATQTEETPSEGEETPEEEQKEGEGEEKPSTPEIVEEFPAKVYGREGVVKRYSDGRVVFEVDGHPVREFKDMQELVQKGLASDEKFQQAAMLKKQAEMKIQELEKKKAEIGDKLLDIATRIQMGKDEVQKLASEYGITLTEEDLENLEYGDAATLNRIYQDVLKEAKRKKDEVERELQRAKSELMQFKLQEYLEAEPIRLLNEATGDRQIGTLFLANLETAVRAAAQAAGKEITEDQLPLIWDEIVKTIDEALNKVVEKKFPAMLNDKQKAEQVFKQIVQKYPDFIEQAKKQAVEEYIEKVKKGNMEASTGQGGVGQPQQPVKLTGKEKPEDLIKFLD